MLVKEDIERKKRALEEEKALIDERLNRRKQAEDEAKKYEELREYRSQLALIQMDPTRTRDAAQLRNKISELESEISWDLAEREAEAAKDDIQENIDAYTEYVEAGDESLAKFLEDSNNFTGEVNSVLRSSHDDLIAWLKNNVEEYSNSLAEQQEQMVTSWDDTYKQMYGIVDTYWDQVNEILSSKEAFLTFMEMSDDFVNASETMKESMLYQWNEAFDGLQRALKDTHEFVHEELAGITAEIASVNAAASNTSSKNGGGGGGGGSRNKNSNSNTTTNTLSSASSSYDPETYIAYSLLTKRYLYGPTTRSKALSYATRYPSAAVVTLEQASRIGVIGLPSRGNIGSNGQYASISARSASDASSEIGGGGSAYDNSYETQRRQAAMVDAYREQSSSTSSSAQNSTSNRNNTANRNSTTNTTQQTTQTSNNNGGNIVNYLVDGIRNLFGFDEGGLIDFTGPAVVHGSTLKPESILDAETTALLREAQDNGMIANMRNMLDAMRYVSVNPLLSNVVTPDNEARAMNVGDIDITVNVASMNDDADIEDLSTKLGEQFVKELSKKGYMTGNYAF